MENNTITDSTDKKPARPGRSKTIAFSAIVFFMIATLCLAVFEIGLRLTMTKQEKVAQSLTYVNLDGYYTYAPGALVSFTNEDGDRITFTADEHGLRNPADTLPGADVLILGDSFMNALNTRTGQTVADLLHTRGYKIYNASMDGYATVNSLYLLEDLLKESKPQTVLLFFYLGNDLRDNYFTAMRQGPDLSPQYARQQQSENLLKRICRKSALCYRINQLRASAGQLNTAKMKSHRKPGAPPPHADPMANYCLSEIMALRSEYEESMKAAVSKTGDTFAALADLASKHNIRLVIIGLPSRAMVYEDMSRVPYADVEKRFEEYTRQNRELGFSYDRPDLVVQELAANNGIEYFSVLELFQQSRNRRIFFKEDPHWTALGQKITADFVADKILK